MKKALRVLVLAICFAALMAVPAMATYPSWNNDGAGDVKVYGDVTAEYGQGVTTSQGYELGCVKTQSTTVSGEASGMGALNTVGKCGGMVVLDGEFSYTEKASTVNAAYSVNTQATNMAGANDMNNVAGASFCATGDAGVNGSFSLNQSLNQGQLAQYNGGAGVQCYSGSVTLNGGVGN